jgi:hypothetical protein
MGFYTEQLSTKVPFGSIWRHRTSKKLFCIVGYCLIEKRTEPAILYTSIEPENLMSLPFCRPAAEFLGGHFEMVEVRS